MAREFIMVKNALRRWYNLFFGTEEIVALLVFVMACTAVVFVFGKLLVPVFVAVVLAYLMGSIVRFLVQRQVPEMIAVLLVYLVTLGGSIAVVILVLPLAWIQFVDFVQNSLPELVEGSRLALESFSETSPQLAEVIPLKDLNGQMSQYISGFGEELLSNSFSKLPNLFGLAIYTVMVPVLVFFMLKDRNYLKRGFLMWVPAQHSLLEKVWVDMDKQLTNYIRGKVFEIVIVSLVSYVAFLIIGVNYAELLAVMVGVSVVVPLVGAFAVTIPVMLVGYFQFGLTSPFYTLFVVYGIIQVLDGNVLVPLLFSEVVNLHPVSIILAVLLFGGLWGLWGVFFAIPLATLIKSVVTAWPTHEEILQAQGDEGGVSG